MATLTVTLEPTLSIPAWSQPVDDVPAMLAEVEEHAAWTAANNDVTESFTMTSDDERTVWHVVTIAGLGTQVDTFTLA